MRSDLESHALALHTVRSIILVDTSMGENFEPKEQREITAKEVIDALTQTRLNKGDTRACEPYQQFLRQQEALATKEDTNKANVERAIFLARIYASAGYLEEALEELEKTLQMVNEPEDEDLRKEVWGLMDEVEIALEEARQGA